MTGWFSASAAPGQIRWRFTTGGPVSSTAAIASNGDVVFGSQDGKIYALDPATGQPRWSRDLGQPITASPLIAADGTLYIRDGDGNLHALDGATGLEKRSYPLPNHPWWLVSSPVLAPSGDLIVAAFEQQIRRLNPVTGTNAWSFSTAGRWVGSPALGTDNTLVVGSYEGNVLGIDATLGTQRWKIVTEERVLGSPAVWYDSMAYVVTGAGLQLRGHLLGIQLRDGAVLWSVPLGQASRSSPIVGPDGTVFVGNDNGLVYAFDGSTGSQRWQAAVEGTLASAPALTREGTLLIGSLNGSLYALDSLTGQRLWDVGTQGELYSSPAVGLDGTVYVGSADRSLYAIEGTAPLALGAWPKFMGTADNRGAPPSNTGPPVITVQSASSTRALGSSLELRVHAVGDLPLHYAWSLNGTLLTHVTGTTLLIPEFAADHAGTYQVVITNVSGAITSAPISMVLGYRVEVRSDGLGTIDATPLPAIDGSYAPGTAVQLQARPQSGHTFAGWTGTTNTASNPIQVVVDGPKSVVAHFPWLPGDTRWETHFPSGLVRALTLGEDGTLYASMASRNPEIRARLAAMNADSGKIRWTYTHPIAVTITGSAIGNDGTLFVGLDNTIEAIDPVQGTRQWVRDLGSPTLAPAIGGDGTVYVTTLNGALRALNPSDGVIRWTVGRNSAPTFPDATAPVVGLDGTLYTALKGTWLRAYDPSGTRTNWSVPIDDWGLEPSLALGADGSVIALQGTRISAFDPITGGTRWSTSLNLPIPANSAYTCVGPDNTVYVATPTGQHAALDGVTGAFRWQASFGPSAAAPTLATDGTLYISSTGLPGLLAVDSQSSSIRWSFPQRIATAPILGPDGVVYVGANLGAGSVWGPSDYSVIPETAIYALHGTSPLSPSAPWPSQRRDSVNRASQQQVSGPPRLIAQSRSQAPALNSTVTLGVIAGGTNLTFEWTLNGNVLPDARESRLILTNFSAAQIGVYQVRVFNELGSVLSEPFGVGNAFRITAKTRGLGTVLAAPAEDLYVPGTTVRLTASPSGPRRFLGWFGDVSGTNNPLTVVLNTNIQVTAAFESFTGDLLWERPLDGGFTSTPALGRDGVVILPSTDNNVYSIDPFNGEMRWKFASGAPVRASAAVDHQNRVFVGSGDTWFYALDGDTGTQLWRYWAGSGVVSSAALTSDGTVIFGSLDDQVHAVDANTGTKRWTYNVGDHVEASPVVTPEGAVIIGTGFTHTRQGSVIALNAGTGRLLWTNNVGWSVGGSLALGVDDSVVFADGNGRRLISLDRRSGQPRWATEVGATWYLNSPVISPDGLAYIVTGEKGLQVLNAATGQFLWEAFAKRFLGPVGNPAVTADGTLYLGIGREFHALDAATGAKKWSYLTVEPMQAGLTIAPDGTVYVATSSSTSSSARLLALQGSAPLAATGWPKARGDLRNTGHAPGNFDRPRLTVQSLQLPNQIALRLHGPPGQALQIQGAAELPHWETLQVLTNATGSFDWLDLAPPSTRRFYRAQTVQP
ncbi:MAG: PQQ-binding-like beta-propeller repeat protein [Verrucomicrobiales bacterium]|nr:PQQ-binding-like beta-propeller repeat protein [Verrucomicrobiales bacterium]